MKKALLSIFLCLLLLFALTGCGDKTVVTTNEFKAKAESLGFETADITEQYASYGYIQEATIAHNQDGAEVEFYVLDDTSNATSMFNTNKSDFENNKGSSSLESSSSMGNYSSYSLTSNGYYMHLCRVDNTLVFVKVDSNLKDATKKLTDELGY